MVCCFYRERGYSEAGFELYADLDLCFLNVTCNVAFSPEQG